MLKKLSDIGIKGINILFFILCLDILLIKAVYEARVTDSAVAVLLSVISACFVVVFLFWYFTENKKTTKIKQQLSDIPSYYYLIFLLVISVCFRIIFHLIFKTDFYGTSDRETYINMLNDLYTKGQIIERADYATRYSYTVTLVLLLFPFAKLFGLSVNTIYALNIIVQVLKTALFFGIIKRFTDKGTAFWASLFYSLCVEAVTQTYLPTHEHTVTLFTMATFYFLFCFFPVLKKFSHKIIISALAGITACMMYISNSSSKIFFIALAIYFVLAVLKNKISVNRKVLVKYLCLLLVFAFAASSLYFTTKACKKNIIADCGKLPYDSLWRTVYCGANYESAGEYVIEDIEGYTSKLINLPESKAAELAKKLAVERVKDTYSSFSKSLNHLQNKMKNMWSDITFGRYYMNGKFKTETQNALFTKITSVGLCFFTVSYLAGLIIIIISIIKRKASVFSPVLVLWLFVIGFTMALLIGECNSKYMLNCQWVMIVSVAYSLYNLKNKRQKK